MNELIAVLLPAFVSLFVVIDPPGMMPVFMVLTEGTSRAYKRAMALRTVVIAGVVLAIFAFVGNEILNLFGISLAAFKIASGIMLFLIATEMVFERRSERRRRAAENLSEERSDPEDSDIAVFPMAIPMIAGPGSISTIMLLMSNAENDLPLQMSIVGVLALLLASCYLFFLSADFLGRVMNLVMAKAFSRILGIILAALAAQYILDGLLVFWNA